MLGRSCPRCGRVRHLRPAGICAICDRPAGPARPVKIISCGNCGQLGRDAGHEMCSRCKLADPDWPFRYGASLAARLPAVPPWWQALTEYSAARHHPGGAVTILRHAGRVISAGPRQILAAATRADGTLDAAGRALDGFFTSQGLILPGDQATRRAAAALPRGGNATWTPSRPGSPARSPRSTTASSPTKTEPAAPAAARSVTSPSRAACGSSAIWPAA